MNCFEERQTSERNQAMGRQGQLAAHAFEISMGRLTSRDPERLLFFFSATRALSLARMKQ